VGWTADGSFVAISDGATVVLAPRDGSEAAFRARGPAVRWSESGEVAFFGSLDRGSGLVVAARTPAGWTEIANHPDAASPAIDTRAGRYAFGDGASVHVGEVMNGDGDSAFETLRSFGIPDALPATQLESLVWSPDAGKLALLRWEEGETHCHTDSFTGISGCRTDRLDLQLLVIDLEDSQVTQRPSPVALLPASPTLRWRDSETLIWGGEYGVPQANGLGIDLVTGPFGVGSPFPGIPSPNGELLAVPGNFSGTGSGLQIWPRAAGEALWYDPALGWWVMRIQEATADSLWLEWAPDSTKLAVVASGAEAVVPATMPRAGEAADAEQRTPTPTVGPAPAATQALPVGSGGGSSGDVAFVSNRDGSFDVFVVNVHTGMERRLTSNQVDERNPAWAPDGRMLAFNYGGSIRLMNADGTLATQLRTAGWTTWSPAFDPNGDRVAFSSTRDNNTDIYVVDLDDREERRLTTDPSSDSRPVWAPDGDAIAYVSDSGGDSQIWLLSLSSGESRPLTSGPGERTRPAWSPDGSQIAFTFRRPGTTSFEIWVIGADGASPRRITDGVDPTWSPDGEWIAFMGWPGIYIARADGTQEQQITSDPAAIEPDWAPIH